MQVSSNHARIFVHPKDSFRMFQTITPCPFQMKYTAAMRDKADLSDKADQLEHLVTQLQGETDTIGEGYRLSQSCHQHHVFVLVSQMAV